MMRVSFDAICSHLVPNSNIQFEVKNVHNLSGVYELVDFYYPGLECDSRTVGVVIRKNGKTYATITYGWEPSKYYQEQGLEEPLLSQVTKGFLEPLEEQSLEADLFLEIFQYMIDSDSSFIDTFKERYALFKSTLEDMQDILENILSDTMLSDITPINSNKFKQFKKK